MAEYHLETITDKAIAEFISRDGLNFDMKEIIINVNEDLVKALKLLKCMRSKSIKHKNIQDPGTVISSAFMSLAGLIFALPIGLPGKIGSLVTYGIAGLGRLGFTIHNMVFTRKNISELKKIANGIETSLKPIFKLNDKLKKLSNDLIKETKAKTKIQFTMEEVFASCWKSLETCVSPFKGMNLGFESKNIHSLFEMLKGFQGLPFKAGQVILNNNFSRGIGISSLIGYQSLFILGSIIAASGLLHHDIKKLKKDHTITERVTNMTLMIVEILAITHHMID